jgi:hypothetical protein
LLDSQCPTEGARLPRRLGLAGIASPTTAALAVLDPDVALLDARPTQTRVSRVLPGRCHDALNRLPRLMPLSTRALMGLLLAWVQRPGAEGYLGLDDVVVEQAFANKLPWAACTYSFAQKRTVHGLHIVVLLWCSADARWRGPGRLPAAFRLWRHKRSCAPPAYRTKLHPAEELVKEVVAAGLPFAYLMMDTDYTAGRFTKVLGRLGITWVGTIASRTTVVHRGRRQQVQQPAPTLRLTWRRKPGVRATALRVYAPSQGQVGLVVTRNRHGCLLTYT